MDNRTERQKKKDIKKCDECGKESKKNYAFLWDEFSRDLCRECAIEIETTDINKRIAGLDDYYKNNIKEKEEHRAHEVKILMEYIEKIDNSPKNRRE